MIIQVCSIDNSQRVLPRLAIGLAAITGWQVEKVPNPQAVVNYYIPYLGLPKSASICPTAALFTHRDDSLPGKVAIWNQHAETVGLRVTWANQYAEELRRFGHTLHVKPPLDRDFFTLGTARAKLLEHGRYVAGISGYTYPGGRKGEALIAAVMQTPEGHGVDWTAIGRGWPCETKRVVWKHVPDFYRSLDFYVCSSTIEGIPYGPLEALACGVPVIVPIGVGIMDDLPTMPGVIHYEAGNVVALGTAINEVRTQLELGEFDRETLRNVTEPFTWQAYADAHIEAFSQLIGGLPPKETKDE